MCKFSFQPNFKKDFQAHGACWKYKNITYDPHKNFGVLVQWLVPLTNMFLFAIKFSIVLA